MSKIEYNLKLQLKLYKITGWSTEYKFHPIRRWRFDFAWAAEKIAVECEGGVFTGGRHTRGAGFTNDCEKYNEAICMGWRVLRVTSDQVNNGEAIRWIERLIMKDLYQVC